MSELYQKALHNLQNIWGFPDFRTGQDKAVSSVLDGNETLVLFPTGGGKSLCYQVPATVLDGITLVISPLVALMQDQVDQANKLGIKAAFINSTISRNEVNQRLINARNGMYKLLYAAPERLQTDLWQSELPNLNISLVAIDEAHCISEWGHDFRPPYRQIRQSFSNYKGNLRWLALTATATPEVRKDILNVLQFKNPNIISTGFNRKNLRWWVIHEEQKEQRILSIVKKATGSGLIYASTRRGCEDLARNLSNAGFPTEAYHAGRTSQQREDIQRRWIDGSLPLVTATNAFGMGIDKPDCRYVIHYDIPYSMESYYQEAGRAGRNGDLSYPMVLYRKSDAKIAQDRLSQSYPDITVLQKAYDALCDYWQIAVNSEMPEFELIDFDSLAKRSKLKVRTVRQATTLLQQLGLIQLITHHKEQISILFNGTIEGVRSQIQMYKNKNKANFADILQRIYGPEAHGSFISMDLIYVAEKTGANKNALLKALLVFQNEQLLQFRHLEDEPLGKLLFERTKKLAIDIPRFKSHRQNLFTKLERMHLYLETKGCRSKYIRTYFGEENVPKNCGNCDYCLKQDSGNDEIINKVYDAVSSGFTTPEKIKSQVGCRESELKSSLTYLIKEDLIYTVEEDFAVRYQARKSSIRTD